MTEPSDTDPTDDDRDALAKVIAGALVRGEKCDRWCCPVDHHASPQSIADAVLAHLAEEAAVASIQESFISKGKLRMVSNAGLEVDHGDRVTGSITVKDDDSTTKLPDEVETIRVLNAALSRVLELHKDLIETRTDLAKAESLIAAATRHGIDEGSDKALEILTTYEGF